VSAARVPGRIMRPDDADICTTVGTVLSGASTSRDLTRELDLAVLRLEDGRTFARREMINHFIAPAAVDAVPVPEGIDDLLAQPSLSPDATATLLTHADPGLDARCREACWPPPLAQVFWPGMPPQLQEQVASFGPAHTNPADEIHHVVRPARPIPGHGRGATR
jgi:hypothetical protein